MRVVASNQRPCCRGADPREAFSVLSTVRLTWAQGHSLRSVSNCAPKSAGQMPKNATGAQWGTVVYQVNCARCRGALLQVRWGAIGTWAQ